MKNSIKKYLIQYVLLATIVVISITHCIYIFVEKKEGFHSDEPWSYGFANSSTGGFVYTETEENKSFLYSSNEDLKNFGSWTDGNIFREYLIADGDERFSFSNVISNKAPDMSPPLYELILHLICSFFPGKFSWWYAFSINIVCGIAILVLLFFLAEKLSKNYIFALIVTFFYGMSTAFSAMMIFLRMYALLTALGLGLLLLNLIAYKKEHKGVVKEYIGMVAIILLGSYTQYIFLPFAFTVTLVMCIALLVKKQWKKLLIYGAVMCAAVGLFFAICPNAFSMSFGTADTVNSLSNDSFDISLFIVSGMLSLEIWGLPWLLDNIGYVTLFFSLIILFVFAALILWIIRNEKWSQKLMTKLRAFKDSMKEHTGQKIVNALGRVNWFVVMMIVTAIGCTHFVSHFANVEAMGEKSDRYVFNIVPMLILTVSYVIYCIINKISKDKKYVSVVAVLVLCVFFSAFREWNLNGICPYTWNRGEDKTNIRELTADSDVIIVTGEGFRLEWYSAEIMDCDEFYAIGTWDYIEQLKKLEKPENGSTIYMLVEEESFLDESMIVGEGEDAMLVIDPNNVGMLEKLHTFDTVKEFEKNVLDNVDWIESIEYIHRSLTFNGVMRVYAVNIR